MAEPVVAVLDDGVLTLTLNRPGVLNAINFDMVDALEAAIRRAEADSSVRAVVLAGEGRAFCAGADLSASRAGGADAVIQPRHMNGIIQRLLRLPKPVIAQVHGAAAGIGCSLALCADFLLMGDTGYLLLAFDKIGLMPDGGATALLGASMGRHRALRVALAGERISADTAEQWGLAECHSDADLAEATGALATRLAQGPTVAYALTKRAINAETLPTVVHAMQREDDGQALLRTTADFQGALKAFIDKTTPQFHGK